MNEPLVVLARSIIAFVSLLIFTRLIGKEQISQLTFFDYVNGITIGSIAASLSTDLTSGAWPHWVGMATWVGAVTIVQLLTIRSRQVSKYIDGEPIIVIMNGKIMDSALRLMRFRISDLMEQLRQKDVFDISQVEFAVLETSGNITVLKRSQYQPVTPQDLNIPTSYKGLSTELVYNGLVIEQNLRQVNLDRQWLKTELNKIGIRDPAEVFYAELNSEGELYVDKYSDHILHLTDISDYKGPN